MIKLEEKPYGIQRICVPHEKVTIPPRNSKATTSRKIGFEPNQIG